MDNEKFSIYCERFAKYGVTLNENQYRLFGQYADLLINEKQNLSAVRDKEAIWTRHFLDSAFLVQFLPMNAKVLDIGTGGGIPAIPLAILRPDLDISMLDSEQNKIDFCTQAVETLKINANPICARAEELAHDPQFRSQFDVIVSRAMAAGSMLTELSISFLRIGGKLIAMKGRNFDPTLERFDEAASALLCDKPVYQRYTIENEEKTLVTVVKMQPTEDKYPRRFAKIKRNPL